MVGITVFVPCRSNNMTMLLISSMTDQSYAIFWLTTFLHVLLWWIVWMVSFCFRSDAWDKYSLESIYLFSFCFFPSHHSLLLCIFLLSSWYLGQVFIGIQICFSVGSAKKFNKLIVIYSSYIIYSIVLTWILLSNNITLWYIKTWSIVIHQHLVYCDTLTVGLL